MEYYLSLMLFTFVAGITPGPNNLMLMSSGLNHGIRKSLPHYFGICFGFPLMVIVVSLGFGALLLRHPNIYFFVKIVGIVYLIYLAWKIANAGNSSASRRVRAPITFLQAVIFQWLNPKAWAIIVSSLAAFTNAENFNHSIVSVILIYFIMGFICMAVWLKLGQSLKSFLSGGNRTNIFNTTMAILLVLSIIPMALSGAETQF